MSDLKTGDPNPYGEACARICAACGGAANPTFDQVRAALDAQPGDPVGYQMKVGCLWILPGYPGEENLIVWEKDALSWQTSKTVLALDALLAERGRR